MADTVGLMKREHAGSDRGSTETAEDGPSEDDGRSRRSLDHRLRSAHHYEPHANSLDLSDPSGTGDTLSVDTTNTNLSTETTSSSLFHRHLDGSQLVIEEVIYSGCSYDQSDFEGSPYSRRSGRLPGQPFPTGPSWWIGYPSTVRREKEREREERVRVAREKLAEERKKKIEEFKEQQRLAQQHRERQQELRRRKIDELRRREEERRAAVEERRRKQEEEQRARREAILQKAQERVARYEQWKQQGRHRGGRIYGFGSRTPREICLPLDRKRSSSHSTLLRRSPNDSDSDSYVRPQRRAVSACSMVRRHCCVDVKPADWSDSLPESQGSYPASVPPSKHLSVSTSVLYYKRSPEFSSTGTLNSSNRPESLLALNTIPEKRRSFLAPATPQRPKSTIGLHMSASVSSPAKPREMRTPRKPRPASIAGTMPGFVPLDVPKSSTPRSKSSERISKADKPRNRSSTTDSAKSDKSAGSANSTQSKSSRKAIFDRLSTPKKPTETSKTSEKKSSAPNSGTTTPTPRRTKSSSKEKGARESPNREGTPTLPEDVMTRSTNDQMSRSTQDITEEEYKLKLAEKRRQAREKAEKEAELERQRQEELRRQEEERLRLEELEQKRLEEESIRLAEEAKKAEEERFLKAIEAEEQRKKDEAERLEIEKKQKEEAERKAKEEAERLEKERIERAKKEEEERLARKKRLEMIMKRVKTDTDTVRQDSPSKSLQSSPSRSSNSSTEISPDEKPEEELHPTAPTTDTLNKASSQEDMRSSGDEEKSTAKFKSPLLKQLMDKRTDDSSTDGSPKFKSPILQNILGKSKSNLGNRLMKTSSSEKLGSSQESLDQPINDSIYNAKDVERRKSDADKDVDTAEGNHVDKQKSLNRLSVSFDHSVGMDDSGFADSNGSTKVPQIDVNGTGKPVGLSTESVIVSLVDNDLDNRENTEHSTLPGALPWASPGKTSAPVTTSALTHQTSGEDTTTIAGVCDTTTLASSAKCPQDEINPLIDLSLANKNIDLKSQQLQDNLRNNSDDLLNFNSINAGTGDHSPLIPFEDNASQRQDVTGFPMQNSFKDSMLAGNSNIISNSSSCSSHDPLRTSSAFCPQMGSAAAVATDHNSSQGTEVHLNGVNTDLQNDASLMLPLPPFTSSELLSTTLNSTMPVTSSASCLSQPITRTTDLMLTTNGSSENGLCTEDSEDYFLSTHHHCHGSISSSDSGVISSAGSQEEEMPLETSPSSSEQPASCGSTLSMGDVGGGKYQISLAEVADNGNIDDGIKSKQYLKNSVHSVINPINSSSSEMSPVSWIQTSSTLTNANINIVSDRLSPLVNNSAVNANPDSFSKKIAPVNNNNPPSVGYLWMQFEKLMPRKHESVSATLHQYGIGKGAGLSHGMENSEEDQFWDIVQSRSFLNIA